MTLIASSSVFVMAEPTVIDGPVESTVTANDGDDIKVQGDVDITESSNPGDYVGVNANGGNVEVTGDVTGTEEGVAFNNGGSVTVGGDVSGDSFGILSDNGGTAKVGGDVNGGVFVTDADVEIKGNVEKTNTTEWCPAAVQESGDSTIKIGGSVTSSGSGIKTDGDSVIVIEGAIAASGSSAAIILDQSKSDFDDVTYETIYSKDDSVGVSKIVVHEIKGDLGNDSNLVKAGYLSGTENYSTGTAPTFTEDAGFRGEQIKNIFYIIKKSENSDKGIASLSGTTQFDGISGKIDAAPENTKITVTVKEGYGVKAGTIEITKNADGTYSLIVPRGGGVTLTAELLEKAAEEIEKKEEEEKKNDKDDDKKDESKTIATIASNNVSPFVAYAPVLTIGGGQAVLSGGTFGADTGIKMEEPGPLAEAAFAAAMPAGFAKAFSFSVTNGGQTTYSIKNGKISFKIPAQYLLAGRQFKLIGVDKDGKTKVFDNVATEDGSFEADVDIEGYQFELVYKD